jgi:hypothetical protein
MAKIWQPKKVVNCAMCYGKHSHPYEIIDLDIWWVEDTPYIKYHFCSICYTILNKLWPDDTKLTSYKSNQIYVESDVLNHTEYLYNLIKNNYIKYNAFVNARSNYIKYITYPSIIYELYHTNTSILHVIPKDVIDYIIHIFRQL